MADGKKDCKPTTKEGDPTTGSADSFKINIQGSLLKFALDVSPNDSIVEVKEHICGIMSDATVSSLKLIYSGRILKDDSKVSEYNIQAGHTVHLVKSSAKPAESAGQSTQPVQPAQSTLPQMAPGIPVNPQMLAQLMSAGSNPPSSLRVGEADAMMAQLLDEMSNNPQLMRQLLQAFPQQFPPETMEMLQNPEYLRMAARMARLGMLGPDRSQVGGAEITEAFRMTHGGSTEFATSPQPDPTGQTRQHEQPNEPPEVRFAAQLQQLNDMGFWDKQSNIQALLLTNGSVSQAVEWLLAHPPE